MLNKIPQQILNLSGETPLIQEINLSVIATLLNAAKHV